MSVSRRGLKAPNSEDFIQAVKDAGHWLSIIQEIYPYGAYLELTIEDLIVHMNRVYGVLEAAGVDRSDFESIVDWVQFLGGKSGVFYRQSFFKCPDDIFKYLFEICLIYKRPGYSPE